MCDVAESSDNFNDAHDNDSDDIDDDDISVSEKHLPLTNEAVPHSHCLQGYQARSSFISVSMETETLAH